MLTDSEADNENYFKDIIQHTKAVGVEFLGIGIMDDAILHYLPREDCCVIKDLNRLAPEMFRMLRNKLLGAAEEKTGAAFANAAPESSKAVI